MIYEILVKTQYALLLPELPTVGQGPIVLAVGAGGVVWTFLLSSVLSLLFLPLFGRRPVIEGGNLETELKAQCAIYHLKAGLI